MNVQVLREHDRVVRHPERESRDPGGGAARGTSFDPPNHPGPSTHARDDSALDLTPFFGRWTKTNEVPGQWIERVEIQPDGDDGIRIHVWGADSPSPTDWGAVRADALFANAIASSKGSAFIARYDFGFMESELQGNVNLGLLVLAGYHRFRDARGADLFSREFYRRENAQ